MLLPILVAALASSEAVQTAEASVVDLTDLKETEETLEKEEEVCLNDYEDIHEVRVRIGNFITRVYHQKRPHSVLGYLTPMEFEQQNLT